jgi:hypothetical protein
MVQGTFEFSTFITARAHKLLNIRISRTSLRFPIVYLPECRLRLFGLLVHTQLYLTAHGAAFSQVVQTATSYYATILIIVSITVTTTESEAGGGVVTPVVGISPATAVAESAQASATANTSRFILFSFVIEDARTLAIIPYSFENKLVAKPNLDG